MSKYTDLKKMGIEITQKALMGIEQMEIADEYKTTKTYVLRVVKETCSEVNPQWFSYMPIYGNGTKFKNEVMDWLIENRRMFFPEMPTGVSRIKELKKRHFKIAKEVLNGETLAVVGKKYKVTHIRIKQIVNKHCFDMSGGKRISYHIEWLRENKELFLS